MSDKVVAARYAAALMKLSDDDNSTKSHERLKCLKAVLEIFAIPDAARVLKSRVMPSDLKLSLLNYALSKSNGDKQLQGFVHSIVESGRVSSLPAIVEKFQELIDEKDSVVRATILTASTMTDSELQEIRSCLEKMTKKTVQIVQKTDSSLLGGFVARLGNNLIDLSLRTKLDALTVSAAV